MKTLVAIAVATLLAVSGAYFGSPYLATRTLKQAALSGDADKLDAAVDFPAVRESLKSQMSAALITKLNNDPDMKDNPFAGLGMMILPAVIDKAVDAYVTSDGLAALVRGAKPDGAEKTEPTDNPDLKYEYEWVSLDRFRVTIKNTRRKEQGPALLLERRGLTTWKLVKLELPSNLLSGEKDLTDQEQQEAGSGLGDLSGDGERNQGAAQSAGLDYRELNQAALTASNNCYGNGGSCDEARRLFEQLEKYKSAKRFCTIEVTRYVSQDVPCEYENEYSAAFTGSLGTEQVSPVSAPVSEPVYPADVVSAFYESLGRGDGAAAVALMVPEKAGRGNYAPAAMSQFYGKMTEPLELIQVKRSSDDEYVALYRYRAGRTRCEGGAVVSTTKRGAKILIENIRTLGNC